MDAAYRIRPAAPADLPAITAAERAVFTDAWTEAGLAAAIGPYTLVAESESELVGYLFARLAADEAEILNVAVYPEHRRRGVAAGLVHTSLDALRRAGARSVYLEVRESNEAARAFYNTLGFIEAGRRPRYYRRPVEDAVVMKREM